MAAWRHGSIDRKFESEKAEVATYVQTTAAICFLWPANNLYQAKTIVTLFSFSNRLIPYNSSVASVNSQGGHSQHKFINVYI